MHKFFGHLRFFLILVIMLAVIPVYAALRCSVCGNNIHGRYFTVNGKTFCSKKCFRSTLPKCSECNAVLDKRYFKKNGKLYCQKCFDKTIPDCSMCGIKLRGRYANIGGRFYCMDCAGKARCFSCQRPADGGELSDGRHVCKECMRDPVTSLDDLNRIRKNVSALLDRHLDIKTPPEVEIEIVDFQTLKKKSPHYSEGIELGLFEYKCKIMTRVTRNIFTGKEETQVKKTDERYIIYILSHLPRNKAKEVMAHELAHAWMQKNYSGIKDLKVREGWSQYVAHRANTLMGQEGLNNYIETNRDPIYGDGYRQIRELADEKGEQGLRLEFRRLSRNGNLN